MCNFRDSITFKHVGKEEIDFVENFMKTKLPAILLNWMSRENKLPIVENDFFGPVYECMPSSFEFTPGDRLQIATIGAYVKKVTATQPQYFKNPIDTNPNENAQIASCPMAKRPIEMQRKNRVDIDSVVMKRVLQHICV